MKFVLPHAQAFAVERDVPVVWLRAFEVGAIFQSAAGVATGEPWAGSLGGHHDISAYNARYKVSYPDVRVLCCFQSLLGNAVYGPRHRLCKLHSLRSDRYHVAKP